MRRLWRINSTVSASQGASASTAGGRRGQGRGRPGPGGSSLALATPTLAGDLAPSEAAAWLRSEELLALHQQRAEGDLGWSHPEPREAFNHRLLITAAVPACLQVSGSDLTPEASLRTGQDCPVPPCASPFLQGRAELVSLSCRRDQWPHTPRFGLPGLLPPVLFYYCYYFSAHR